MFLENCYNEVVKNFTKWINEKFFEWRGASRRGVTDFAEYVGVSQQTMSLWLNGDRGNRLSPQSIAKLAEKFPDVYEAVGLTGPSRMRYLPSSMRRRLEQAQAQTERCLRERGLTGEDPEAEEIAIRIFERHGFKYTETKNGPD